MRESIGVLHPGAMGRTLGRALKRSGHRVCWTSDGRSSATRERAESEQFDEIVDLTEFVDEVSVIVSVCPPHGSERLVQDVAAAGFRGTFIDANAITPERSAGQARRMTAVGATYIDGSIIGPPAEEPGTTRLYLSGEGSQRIVGLFEGSVVQAIALQSGDFAASALKMVYAGYTKGSAALLLAVAAAAHVLDVDDALRSEWSLSMPELGERADRLMQYAGRKAWRFEEEMRFIAETLDFAGMPDGFHLAAAEIYRRMSGQSASAFPVEPQATLSDLTGSGADRESSR